MLLQRIRFRIIRGTGSLEVGFRCVQFFVFFFRFSGLSICVVLSGRR